MFAWCKTIRRARAITRYYRTTRPAVVAPVLRQCHSFHVARPSSLVSLSRWLSVVPRTQFEMAAKPFERLPTDVIPYNYRLRITPDLTNLTFSGVANITLTVKQPTSAIKLNAIELEFKEIEFRSADGSILKPSKVELFAELEIATFTFPSPLPVGDASLNILYTGLLNDKMKGFYRSKYTTESGESRISGATQFESTYARFAFPCWDEPALKATFDITLVHPNNRLVLSNMNVISETPWEEKSDWTVTTFATSPKMPTYLAAWVIGEYEFVESKTNVGIIVRVYTLPNKKHQGQFALDFAVKSLEFYSKYFNISYPLPKLDLIAIADFAMGAMENWGLVTYREIRLLVDPENSSSVIKQMVAIVVAHELAHQWFGNLVTMEWWTHLWLNEGFASFMEYLCTDVICPEYDIWTEFVISSFIRALELDSLRSSHPIEVPVGHPSEVDEIFDEISYEKGCSVIRMLHNFIGDDAFRKGMEDYLNSHKYSNAVTEQLWSALEKASGKPVQKVMSSWTKQMGFPMIKVTSRQDGNNRVLDLSQERFLSDGSKDTEGYQWLVPISFTTKSSPTKPVKQIILEDRSGQAVLEGVPVDDWVKLNPSATGFYRVQYPADMLACFTPIISDKSLPPVDRLTVLDDVFALVTAGHTPTVDILRLLPAFTNEDNYAVWKTVLNCVGTLTVLLSHTPHHENFLAYRRKLLKPITQKLGWEPKPGEDKNTRMLRGVVLSAAGTSGDRDVITEAQKRLKAYVGDGVPIPADLRSAVYTSVACEGNAATFKTLVELYNKTDMSEEKTRLLQSLARFKDRGVLKEVLEFGISDSVRSQDALYVYMPMSSNKHARDIAWDYYKANIEVFKERYSGGHLFRVMTKSLIENFAREECAIEIENFLREKELSTERKLLQAVESIRINAKWLERDEAAIGAFLSSPQ